MDLGTIARYLDRHPWMSLAAGVGVAAVSVLRIRRDRRAKKENKQEAKLERQQAKTLRKESRVPKLSKD